MKFFSNCFLFALLHSVLRLRMSKASPSIAEGFGLRADPKGWRTHRGLTGDDPRGKGVPAGTGFAIRPRYCPGSSRDKQEPEYILFYNSRALVV